MMNEKTVHAENRLLAAISHAAVVTQGVGILVGIFVYFNQREQSRFAAFQALQAAVYQLVSFVIMGGMWLIWGVFYGLSMIPLIRIAETDPNAAPPAIFWISLGSMVIPLAFMALVVICGLWGAWRAGQGQDFYYPVLGKQLEKSGFFNQEAA